jgi:hypothetical protein
VAKVPFWEDAPFLWQQIKVAGVYLPGTAVVTGSVGRKMDSQQSPGSDGSTMTQLGYEPAKVSIKLTLFFPEHLERFIKIAPVLRPRKGEKNPPAVPVVHPSLTIMGIHHLHVMSIGIPEPGAIKGTYEVKIEMAEFIPERHRRNRVAKPKVATGATAGGSIDLAREFGGRKPGVPTASTASAPSRGLFLTP